MSEKKYSKGSKSKKSTKNNKKKQEYDEDIEEDDDNYEQEYDDADIDDENIDREKIDEKNKKIIEANKKAIERLKKKISGWLDYDDKIKEINAVCKKYKDAKKQEEELILDIIEKLEINIPIYVHDNKGQLRSSVKRHVSTTKEALKEELIKDALMETLKNKNMVDNIWKKIDSKRAPKERYYLKRTKGNKNE